MSPCTVGMNRDLRHLCNQLQGLTQYIGDCHFIRVGIITVQRQNTSLQCIHLILAGSLHHYVTKELTGQFLKTLYNTHKASELLRCGQAAEQQQIGRLFKAISAIFKALDQIFYIISLEIQFAICRHLLSIHTLVGKDVGYLCQTCQYTFTIGITQTTFDVIFCIKFLIDLARYSTFIYKPVELLIQFSA